ncbi:hypothetical protein [Polymorphospora sp. NPDC050346]|uniref:hypothetical protein n=1 Tax=Polymorphospora sp. NPDC050346 TaxID=3155780 RepID=UPI0033CCA4D7
MLVFVSPPDWWGQAWRIEMWRSGTVRVFRLDGHEVSSSPLSRPRTVAELGEWLVERRLDPDQLRQA